jgi:putative polyhydroxyalkanoate system protein
MSDLHVSRSHGLSLKQARTAAEHVAEELAEEFKIAYEWHGNVLSFHRSGIQGTMALTKKHLEIKAKIGFLLIPIKSRIEREIHRFCDENFGPEDD